MASTMEAIRKIAPASIRERGNSPPPRPSEWRNSINPRMINPAPSARDFKDMRPGGTEIILHAAGCRKQCDADISLSDCAEPEEGQSRPVMTFVMLLLFALITGLCGCAHSPHHVKLPASPGAFDQAFLTWFVRYHDEQDRMTLPCAHNDTIRKELREFCAQRDLQHAERLERVRHWLKNWYDKDIPRPDPFPLWLAGLKGEEFEREFFREYLGDHDEGIEQTSKCASMASHSELRELCSRINPMQRKTDKQLRAWRCEWFRDCK